MLMQNVKTQMVVTHVNALLDIMVTGTLVLISMNASLKLITVQRLLSALIPSDLSNVIVLKDSLMMESHVRTSMNVKI